MIYLLVALYASYAPATVRGNPETIVVTGERIDDAAAELRACLARQCSPKEDIDATLKLAETQLLEGKYHEARKTLLDSLGRNKDEAKAYPVPVSELYRANGKVAAHLGLDRDYYRSTWGIYSTLKNGLPSDDHRKFTALMEVAEMMYRTRGHTRARLYYESIARQARAENRPDIAAIAELRSAIRHLPPGSDMQMSEIKRIAKLDGTPMRAPALEARLALARMAFERGDEAGAEEIIRGMASLDIKRPILIYSPSYDMISRELDTGNDFAFPFAAPPPVGGEPGPGGATAAGGPAITKNLNLGQWSSTKRIPENFEDMWVDVGFHITPEGRVADAKILRSKGNLFWTKPLMISIGRRRYTPGGVGDAANYRTERYTYTSGFEAGTGTHLAQRSPKARVEYIDLSDAAAVD